MSVTLFAKGLTAIRGFLAGGTAKSTVVNDDYLLISDSADTDALKRLKFEALKNQIIGDVDALAYKGAINCSANPDYPAADAGHVYKVSHAGKIGGASGETVEAGDFAICNTDATATGDQAAVGDNWDVFQGNIIWETTAGNIAMNGSQSLGSSGLVPNSDHVHPSDTTKADKLIAETAEKTADYTLVIGDADKVVLMNKTGAATLTVPTNANVAFPVGTIVGVYNASSDDVTIQGDGGVTVRNAGDLAQYGEVSLRKRAANEWVLAGAVS